MRYLSGANVYQNGILGKYSMPDSNGYLHPSSGDYFIENGNEIVLREFQHYGKEMQKSIDGKNIASLESPVLMPLESDIITTDNIYEDGFSSGLDGKVTYEEYASGETDYAYTGTDYTNRHVFINGIKLLSGENYSITGEALYLHRETLNELGEGNVSFTPMNEYTNEQIYSGSGAHVQADFPLIKPQVWRNGVRLTEGADYLLSSSGSLLNSAIRIPVNESILYLNNTGFFNE